jgi:hypothetical protein
LGVNLGIAWAVDGGSRRGELAGHGKGGGGALGEQGRGTGGLGIYRHEGRGGRTRVWHSRGRCGRGRTGAATVVDDGAGGVARRQASRARVARKEEPERAILGARGGFLSGARRVASLMVTPAYGSVTAPPRMREK